MNDNFVVVIIIIIIIINIVLRLGHDGILIVHWFSAQDNFRIRQTNQP